VECADRDRDRAGCALLEGTTAKERFFVDKTEQGEDYHQQYLEKNPDGYWYNLFWY